MMIGMNLVMAQDKTKEEEVVAVKDQQHGMNVHFLENVEEDRDFGEENDEGGVLGKICSEELDKVMTSSGTSGEVKSDCSRATKPTGKPELPSFSSLSKPQDIAPMITLKNPNKRTYVPTATPAPSAGNNNKSGQYPCPYEDSCKVADECRSNAGRCGLFPTRLAETYYGYIETVEDAVMIVEACRYGRLMRVKRRLHEKERQGIRSGSVFVFVERESGIRRWTDGKVWSPSRICGEFLLYRELETRQVPVKKSAITQINWSEQVAKILSERAKNHGQASTVATNGTTSSSSQASSMSVSPVEEDRRGSTALTPENYEPLGKIVKFIADESNNNNDDGGHSATKSSQMVFKKDGLIKKTISLTVADETYHLICYFKDSNLGTELLPLTPCRSAQFKNLEICRNPVSYPIMMIQQPQQQQSQQNGSGSSYYPPPSQMKGAPMRQQQSQQQQQQPQYISASSLMYPGGYPMMHQQSRMTQMHQQQHHYTMHPMQQQQYLQQVNGAKHYPNPQYQYAAQFYQKQHQQQSYPQHHQQQYYPSEAIPVSSAAIQSRCQASNDNDIESEAIGCAKCPSARNCQGHSAIVKEEPEAKRIPTGSKHNMSLANLTSPASSRKADLDEAQLLFCFIDAVQPATESNNINPQSSS